MLQLSGSKEWRVFEPAVLLPRDTEQRLTADELDATAVGPLRPHHVDGSDGCVAPRHCGCAPLLLKFLVALAFSLTYLRDDHRYVPVPTAEAASW